MAEPKDEKYPGTLIKHSSGYDTPNKGKKKINTQQKPIRN